MTTRSYLTKFPLYERDDQDWESLLELLDRYRLHENGYTGTSYYDQQEMMMIGMEKGEDIPWCCKYKKEIFVAAWNEVKEMVAFWHALDKDGTGTMDKFFIASSRKYRRQY